MKTYFAMFSQGRRKKINFIWNQIEMNFFSVTQQLIDVVAFLA